MLYINLCYSADLECFPSAVCTNCNSWNVNGTQTRPVYTLRWIKLEVVYRKWFSLKCLMESSYDNRLTFYAIQYRIEKKNWLFNTDKYCHIVHEWMFFIELEVQLYNDKSNTDHSTILILVINAHTFYCKLWVVLDLSDICFLYIF